MLSRVTLGADVAVTSVLLDAAKRCYPQAEIFFAAPKKSYELFEADPRIRYFPVSYIRHGTLLDRLRASSSLWFDDGIVIDPDSRLTQLGVVSICDESRYFIFPSRGFGGAGHDPLPRLASRWACEVFGVDAHPFIAPLPASGEPADVTVSLGVGENPAKRLGDDFEQKLFRAIADTGRTVLCDLGGSVEEKLRVERALSSGIRTHHGSFAAFAGEIARSKLYVGYDSAGAHVASVSGVPLISIFAGFASERMFDRWRPAGTVIRGDHPDPIGAVKAALTCTFRR